MAAKNDEVVEEVAPAKVVGRESKGTSDVAGPPTPVDTIFDKVREAGSGASTFAERAKARVAREKRVATASNKAVSGDESQAK